MNAQRWEEVQVTFNELVEMDASERGRRLARLAMGDPELHRALESLLRADADADARLAPIDSALLLGASCRSDPLGLAGRTVSHFRLHEALGSGGMGVVYRADDTRQGRAVALKRARFLREANAIAMLDHPNLCTVYEFGTSDDGRLFMALALYDGETLRSRLGRDRRVSVRETIDIVRQIAAGLHAAHAAGFVHRDLKPANVMLLPDGLVVGAVFSVAPATLAAQATTTVTRDYESIQSFSDYNPCTNEPIVVSGTIKTTERTTIDANGRSHVAETVIARFDGVSASGAKYTIQAPEHLVDFRGESGDLPFHRNYTLSIRYVSQGSAPNFMLTYVFHWLIAAGGNTKLEVEHVDEKCIGRGVGS